MAGLKVFISSTCVDLDAYRYQLRSLLERMGYEPVMSDHSEVLYDPSIHTHASCIRDVEAADAIVLLIGSRFGGTVVPQALPLIDFDQVRKLSSHSGLLGEKDKISITQAEALRAVELEIPIFTFVDSKVYAEHHVYQANRGNPNIGTMKFPSISKVGTAQSVFDFISYMHHRSYNNGVIPFSSFAHIEDHLVKQWSLLFQRLIHEKRERSVEAKKSSDIIERIEDLKAAILQTIPEGQVRDTAKAVTRYRGLAEFLFRLRGTGLLDRQLPTDISLTELLTSKGVTDITWDSNEESPFFAILILDDGGFIGCFGYSDDDITDGLSEDWESFRDVASVIQEAVIDAGVELASDRRPFVRKSQSFEQYQQELNAEVAKKADETTPSARRRRRIE